ncbi:MAG: DUF2183 domain-containing protein [Bdellovibrionaceae bacterium]|nr:DUF2183 domain-containing protein [Pseudobdellovibrionaceae bacterium]
MKFLSVFLLVSLSVQAWSRTIVVSDIDDTLKISNVRSLVGKVQNAPRTDLVFAGMPEIFQALHERGDVEFVYLSNAPTWLMTEAHQTFLRENAFPFGRTFLRPFGSGATTFKREVIDRLFAEEPSDTEWILIGDNGERDPLVFWDVQQAYPARKVLAYVHAIYPDNVELQGYSFNLRPYGSSYDLAAEWVAAGILSPEQVEGVEAVVLRALLRDLRDEPTSEQAFAPWTNCHPALSFEGRVFTREWVDLLSVGCALGR